VAAALEDTDAALRSADLVNRFTEESARLLDASEVNARRRAEGRLAANLILSRDAGDHVPDLMPIKDRFGPAWGCFVEMPVERGIAMVLGMSPVDAPADLPRREQYAAWAALAAEALGGYDALYIHIKGPDIPAHDGRALDKRDVCEDIDSAFFGELLPLIDLDRVVLAVTADHSTSCVRKAHTADPVPLLVVGGGAPSDSVQTFGEHAAAAGRLGNLAGVEVLPNVVSLLRD
jgi:2,3-bisphosphoglycerate-independent phosphoglycerate mutase